MEERRDLKRNRTPKHASSDHTELYSAESVEETDEEPDDYEYEYEVMDDHYRDPPRLGGGLPLFGLSRTTRIAATVVFVVLALISFFVLADIASSPETHAGTINALDEKKSTVMGLVGASSASSTAITLIPGDAGTPIAEKLVDLSSDFLVVVAALYLEKYLLTIAGFVAFKFLIPIACLLGVAFLWLRQDLYAIRVKCAQIGVRLFLLGICLYALVPVSVFISSMIESTYQQSIQATIEKAEQTTERIEQGTKQQEEAEQTDIISTIASLPETIAGSVTGWIDEAKEGLNGFIEALAVMIVTSCVIPLLVIVFFLWLIKTILGVKVDVPMRMLYPRTLFRRKRGSTATKALTRR